MFTTNHRLIFFFTQSFLNFPFRKCTVICNIVCNILDNEIKRWFGNYDHHCSEHGKYIKIGKLKNLNLLFLKGIITDNDKICP